VTLKITGSLLDGLFTHGKAGPIRFWRCERRISSLRRLTSDSPLWKSDFVRFRPLHSLLGCYQFLFPEISHFSPVCHIFRCDSFVG
jgi:hypothetical protein